MGEGGAKKHRDKLLFLMSAGAVGIVLLVIGGYQLVEFTDSIAFCGQLCHNVMYPEYTVYQESPHSRVPCAECHVGSGAGYLVKSKLSGIPMIVSTITGKFDKPIPAPVSNLRPARETCEQCHRPERFTGDVVRVHTSYMTDEANTARTDIRVMRVGGGEQSVAKDIHWHISAEVYYLPLDEKRQDIAWVGVKQNDGTMVEYVSPSEASQVTPDLIDKDKRMMDCMDCHNRATHVFQSPEDLIDQALAQGKIDSSLPYIKKEGVQALDPVNANLDEANAKIDAIEDYYRDNYPDVYSGKMVAIQEAIVQLKDVARLTTFGSMNVDWTTYADNESHQTSPGCFRCHGNLVATNGPAKAQTIDAGCESCHFFQLPQAG